MVAAALVRLLAVILFLCYTPVGSFIVPTRSAFANSAIFARGKKDADDGDMQELYKSVAEQDPDWFRSFVVDVLGDDTIESDLLDLLEDSRRGSGEYNDEIRGTKEFPDMEDFEEADYFSEIRQDIEVRDNAESIDLNSSKEQSSVQSEERPDLEIEVPHTNVAATEAMPLDEQVKASTAIAAGSAVLVSSSLLSNTNGEDQQRGTPERQTGKDASTKAGADAPVPSVQTTDSPDPIAMTQSQLYVQYQLENCSDTSAVPLEQFLSLGYTQDQLAELEADVLDMIAADSISRPSRGVPDRWKTKFPTAKFVEGVAIDNAETKAGSPIRTQQDDKGISENTSPDREVKANQSNDYFRPGAATAVRPDTMSRARKRPAKATSRLEDLAESNLEQDAPRRAERRPSVEAPRRRRRRTRNTDGPNRNTAPVYNPRGRGHQPTHRGRRRSFLEYERPREDDPPTRYWMGIDTFRNLLRAEFKLREIITFGQLEGPLLDEAEWRLDLYRNWLWTLHTGVGDPVVQSRNERAQREKDRLKRESRIEGDKKRR